jgi:replicative DNA helicase
MSEKIVDNLKKFGSEFQIKCISGLVSDKTFIERISDILEPDSFETDAHKFIVKETISYFLEYKDLPTLAVFKVKVDSIENDLLKQSVVDQLRLVYQKISDTDLKYIKEQFLEFCKNQKIKNAIMESVDHLKSGQYDKIKHVVDIAMKAGMERNIGHEYMVDIEQRMSQMARKTVKTNWAEIDTLMDGGLAGGELGIITACAGSGKCVGPNTEIEIEYYEFGIEINGNSGNQYTLWINPFEKYKLDDKELYGWQIENIFFELENLKQNNISIGSGKTT